MNVTEAKRAINEILAKLEAECGATVTNVGLDYVDITTFGDKRKVIMRGIRIEMSARPGNDWNIG